jgi:hypothetical protein
VGDNANTLSSTRENFSALRDHKMHLMPVTHFAPVLASVFGPKELTISIWPTRFSIAIVVI